MHLDTNITFVMEALKEDRRWLLLGYLEMLEKCPPNGRIVHNAVQKITVLRLCLQLSVDIDTKAEEQIKGIIKELYR